MKNGEEQFTRVILQKKSLVTLHDSGMKNVENNLRCRIYA